MIEQPFWHTSASFPAPTGEAPPSRVDVAVIGGGYTGIVTALLLARRGVDVAVFEAGTGGSGASSRNGGMALTGLKLDAATLLATYGAERARRMFAASLDALDLVEKLASAERIDCDFVRSGHLVVANKPAHARALIDEAETLAHTFDYDVELVARRDLAGEIGSSLYYGGLVDQRSAGIDPAKYLAGLARAAVDAGTQLFQRTPVQSVRRRRGGFAVRWPGGTTTARHVIAASGGYTGPALPRLRRRFVPLGSYIIATEPLPRRLAHDLLPHNRMTFDTRHLLHYFRLTPDQRMLFGGRAGFVPATAASVRESAAILQRDMVQVFPQLRDVPVAYAWGGTLDVPFDMMPHIGQLGGLHYALGYAGHGVAMATFMGRSLAARVCGDHDDNPFDALPRAPLGLYTGNPWFLPLVGVWYQFRDWVA